MTQQSSELDGYLYRAQNKPIWWCREFLGSEFWDLQKQVLLSVRDNRRTSVTACHSIGKTYLTANAAVWFLMAHPNACVLLTAPTYRQVSEVLWRAIGGLYEKAKQRGCPLGGKFYSEPKWELGKEWFMLGFSPQHPEKAQGFHAPYILIILDEASGIPDGVFGALRGIMASGHVRLLMLGNPNKPAGEFHKSFEASRHMYKTFQVSAWDTPNLKHLREACGVDSDGKLTKEGATTEGRLKRLKILRAAEPVMPWLVQAIYVADMEEEFGWDSDIYRVRVLGQFPLGAPDQLVPLHLIMEATYRWDDLPDSARWWNHRHKISGFPVSALDVARFGSAESVWTGRLEDVAAPQVCWTGLDTVQLSAAAAAQITHHDTKVNRVDADGLGGGPFDQMTRMVPGVEEFRGGTTSGVNTDRFANLRAQDFWGLRERYFEGRIAHQGDDRLVGQIASMRYDHRASGQILMVKKTILAADEESDGFDRADSLMMCFGTRTTMPLMEVRGDSTNWSGMYGRT